MTPAQARAARALLKLGVREVAERASVTPNTVSRLEQEEGTLRGPQASTVAVVRAAYEAAGVVFLDDGAHVAGGPGVRLRGR